MLEFIWKRKGNDASRMIGGTDIYIFLAYIGLFFRYYSENGVCIPKLFVTRDDPFWGYSLSISIFNFLAFTYVAAAYLILIRNLKSKTKKKPFEPSREKEIQGTLSRARPPPLINEVRLPRQIFKITDGFIINVTHNLWHHNLQYLMPDAIQQQ